VSINKQGIVIATTHGDNVLVVDGGDVGGTGGNEAMDNSEQRGDRKKRNKIKRQPHVNMS
jgi:hypothetical protein